MKELRIILWITIAGALVLAAGTLLVAANSKPKFIKDEPDIIMER